ncbi:hypothetical protein AB0L75_08435 [Streptomyces sp. NPDC052101]|uniref:hypothetical protein n=1 Tax=Streptomyces sp. NPDC052101 TaxID=3155763 RepID=UPI00344299AF
MSTLSKSHRSLGGIAVLTSAALLASAPLAVAEDSGSSQDARAAAVVEKATGTGDLVRAATAPGVAAKATTRTDYGTATVTAPTRSSGQVRASATDGDTVAVGLPHSQDVTGHSTGNGTVVYPEAAPSTDVAVQPTTDGGARTLVTLKDSAAPTEQRFDLKLPDGFALAPGDNGSVEIVRTVQGGGTLSAGSFDAPWAKDAGGKPVPTHYEISGSTLIQKIDTTADTAFPVVADPKYTWGWVTGTVYYNKKETKWMRNKGNALAAGLAFSSIVGGALGGPAGAVVATGVTGIWAGYTATVASNAVSDNKCLKIKLPMLKAETYSGGYCK